MPNIESIAQTAQNTIEIFNGAGEILTYNWSHFSDLYKIDKDGKVVEKEKSDKDNKNKMLNFNIKSYHSDDLKNFISLFLYKVPSNIEIISCNKFLVNDKLKVVCVDNKISLSDNIYIPTRLNKNPYEDIIDFINKYFIIRLKDYKKSAELFGYNNLKKKMFENNNTIIIVDFNLNFIKNDNKYPIVSILNVEHNKAVKFLIEDLDISFVNLSTIPDKHLSIVDLINNFYKSYNEPKNRKIVNNSMVKLRYNKINKHIPSKYIGDTFKVNTIEHQYNTKSYFNLTHIKSGNVFKAIVNKSDFKKIE